MKKPKVKPVKKSSKEGVLVSRLELWFEKNARTLPWRSNPEPYWVWLSEIMLQQTQVATVLPYFEKFTKQFKTVNALAQAPLDEVLKLWAGLGYYSRARNLHKGAQAIAARLKSKQGFPENRDQWLEIPGVGEYTAGAICSIAYGQPEPIVDGNVVRVLSRIYSIDEIDAKKTEIWDRARTLVTVPHAQPRFLNQALMELGATVCKPKNPQCLICPVRDYCEGKLSPEKFPPPKPKVKWKTLEENKWVLISKQGEVYLEQNAKLAGSKKTWREGLWDFPDAGSVKIKNTVKLRDEFSTRYVVTNHKITRLHQVYELEPKALKGLGQWFSVNELPGLPAPVAKVIKQRLRSTGA